MKTDNQKMKTENRKKKKVSELKEQKCCGNTTEYKRNKDKIFSCR